MSRAEYRGRTRPAPGPSTGAGTLRRPRSLSEYEQQADGSTALFQRAVRLLQPSVSHSSVVHYSAVRWSVQVNLKLVNLRVNTLKWDQMSPKKRVVNQFYQRKQTLTESLNRAWPVSEISESVTSKEAKTKLSNQTYSRQKEKAKYNRYSGSSSQGKAQVLPITFTMTSSHSSAISRESAALRQLARCQDP